MQDRLIALFFLVFGLGVAAAGSRMALELTGEGEKELRVIGLVLLASGVGCAALGLVLWCRAGGPWNGGVSPKVMAEKQSADAAPEPSAALTGLGDDLYGRLLEAEARVQRARWVLVPCLALLLGSYAALWFGWYRVVPGFDWAEPRGTMSYALLIGALYLLWVVGYHMVRRRLYRRERSGLVAQVRAAGIGRYRLLALIERDADLQEIAAELKLDRWEDAAEPSAAPGPAGE